MSKRGRKKKTGANTVSKKSSSDGGPVGAEPEGTQQRPLQGVQKPEAAALQCDPVPEEQTSITMAALEQMTGIPAVLLRVAMKLISEVCEEMLMVLNSYRGRGHLVDLNTLITGRRDPDMPPAFKRWEDYTKDEYELLFGRLTGLVLNQVLDVLAAECGGNISKHVLLAQKGISVEVFQFMRTWADFALGMSSIDGGRIVRNPCPTMPESLPRRRDLAALPERMASEDGPVMLGIGQLVGSTRVSDQSGSYRLSVVKDGKLEVGAEQEIKAERKRLVRYEIQRLVVKTVLWAVSDLSQDDLPDCACVF